MAGVLLESEVADGGRGDGEGLVVVMEDVAAGLAVGIEHVWKGSGL